MSKLGFSGAYNRKKTLGPLQSSSPCQDDQKESHKYSRLVSENKELKEKNEKLKEEVLDVRSALKQITSESSHENVDERRINLIKLQVIQLERQIVLMNEALGCRSEGILETENTMAWLADKLRSYYASEIKGPTVAISRSDLTAMIESLESSRIKLFKSVEKCSKEEVGKDILLLNPFLNSTASNREKLSLLDISLNRMDFINLRHVSQLETKLCRVYKELVCVHEAVHSMTSDLHRVTDLSQVEDQRLRDVLLRASLVVRDACDDLLALTLLCPSAPWPVLSRPLTKEVPVERVVAALPPLPKLKKEEVVDVIKRSIGVCNHRYILAEKEKSALREELDFHRSVHDLQAKYTEDLFDALRIGYKEFETSSKNEICEPLKNIMKAYKKLKKSTSEVALRDFLLILKDNEAQITSIIAMFNERSQDSEDGEAFQTYGSALMTRLDGVKHRCQQRRDKSVREKRSVRDEQRQRDRDLQILMEELEAKYEQQWLPFNHGIDSTREPSDSIATERSIFDSDIDTTDISKSIDRTTLSTPMMVDESKPKIESDKKQGRQKEDRIVVDDPFILRKYLDEDSDWVSVMETSSLGDQYLTNNKNNIGENVDVDCKSVPLNSQGSDSVKSKDKKPSQKRAPNKEWVNDFTTPNDTSTDSASVYTGDNIEKNRTSKKSTSKIQPEQKPSYEPNLDIMQTSLKLKRPGSAKK